MLNKTKSKLIHLLLASGLWIAVYLIPVLVIIGVWDLSSKTLAWILVALLVFLGAERLYALLFNNTMYKIYKK